MKYYATALKQIFNDLITFNINDNLAHDYQLKQEAVQNVWIAIDSLDKDPAHRHEIEGILDFLNDAIVFLEEMKTTRDKAELISHIKEEVIKRIREEIR